MNSVGAPGEPWGLVLAGGESRRMGTDKALLVRPDGLTGLDHAVALLDAHCESVWVSARGGQTLGAHRAAGVIVDAYPRVGPAAGLLSAWDQFPDRPWLVLATDMPWVNSALLSQLLASRDPLAAATGFRHPDGVMEPLCTLWEPRARRPLQHKVAAGQASLSALLSASEVHWLTLDDPARLASVNTPGEWGRVMDQTGPPGGNPGPRSGRPLRG